MPKNRNKRLFTFKTKEDEINMEAKIVTLNNRISMMLMNGSIMVKYIHYCKGKVLEHHPELELKAKLSIGPSSFLNKN